MTGRADAVRDAFDVPAMQGWLRAHVADIPRKLPMVEQFRGGASNLTYLLSYPNVQLVLRRPPGGRKAASAHDMGREYEVQRLLRPAFPAVPTMVVSCDDQSVIGSTFYVMEYVDGVILDAQQRLPGHDLAARSALGLGLFDLLARLHAIDPADVGLSHLSKGSGYVQRQVSGWSRRYRDVRTPDLPAAVELMAWLAAHQPGDVAEVVIHGDWRLDNMVLDPDDLGRVKAVLDWEMATIGDPLMDLGASLAYWVQADDDAAFRSMARQPSMVPGMPTREQIVAHYGAATGHTITDWTFYEVYGLFRLAVIVAQIWWRYLNGQSTNQAFASFGAAAATLIDRAGALVSAPRRQSATGPQ